MVFQPPFSFTVEHFWYHRISYVYVCKAHVLYETFCFTLAYHYTVHIVSNILNSPKEIRQSSTISLLEENRTSEAIRHQGIHKSRKWYSFSLWWNKTMWDKKHPPLTSQKSFNNQKSNLRKCSSKLSHFWPAVSLLSAFIDIPPAKANWSIPGLDRNSTDYFWTYSSPGEILLISDFYYVFFQIGFLCPDLEYLINVYILVLPTSSR